VLALGGRFTVSDIVFQGSQPQALRTNVASWDGCIVRALEEETYRDLLRDAGFTAIEVEVTRRYSLADIAGNGAGASIDALSPKERPEVDGRFVSAFIRARKP
jgi:arsenite methyltransferase